MAGIYGLSNKGRYLENWQEAFYYSGTLTAADLGKAVSLDTTAERTVKLAADGDVIVGRLEVIEDRVQEGIKVCTVSLKFINWVPYTGTAPAVGAAIVGGGSGLVKSATANVNDLFVAAVDTANTRVFVYKI